MLGGIATVHERSVEGGRSNRPPSVLPCRWILNQTERTQSVASRFAKSNGKPTANLTAPGKPAEV